MTKGTWKQPVIHNYKKHLQQCITCHRFILSETLSTHHVESYVGRFRHVPLPLHQHSHRVGLKANASIEASHLSKNDFTHLKNYTEFTHLHRKILRARYPVLGKKCEIEWWIETVWKCLALKKHLRESRCHWEVSKSQLLQRNETTLWCLADWAVLLKLAWTPASPAIVYNK